MSGPARPGSQWVPSGKGDGMYPSPVLLLLHFFVKTVVKTAVFVVTRCHFENLLYIQKILNNLLVNAEEFGTFCSAFLFSS